MMPFCLSRGEILFRNYGECCTPNNLIRNSIDLSGLISFTERNSVGVHNGEDKAYNSSFYYRKKKNIYEGITSA